MRAGALVCLLLALSAPALARDYTIEGRQVYAETGDRRLRMTLFLPRDEGEGLRPGVVLIHGGAWCLGTRHQCRWYGRHLADNGYVAISITYGLMPKHPFPHGLHDAKAAVRWMRLNAERYRIDPDRIAAMGDSAGGNFAMLLAATGPEDGLEGSLNPGPSSAVRAAVSLYGSTDLAYFLDPKGFFRLGGLTRKFIRSYAREPGALAAASPLTYAGPDTPPILFIHGSQDCLVPYDQSQRFYDALRACGVPTRLITVKGRNHMFDYVHPCVRKRLFAEILAFLDQHLRQ